MTFGKVQYTDVSIDITIPQDVAVCYLSNGSYGYTASSTIIFNGSDVTNTIPVDGVAHYLNNAAPSES